MCPVRAAAVAAAAASPSHLSFSARPVRPSHPQNGRHRPRRFLCRRRVRVAEKNKRKPSGGGWDEKKEKVLAKVTMTTIFESNATSSPGRYVLEEAAERGTPPPPEVVYNGTGHYIDGEIEGKVIVKNTRVSTKKK